MVNLSCAVVRVLERAEAQRAASKRDSEEGIRRRELEEISEDLGERISATGFCEKKI